MDAANYETERAALLSEIRKVFKNVPRAGVTLHETEVIDNYGSDAERALDTDRHWWEVKDEWIEEITGVGGLVFLDAPGFHYYLPAYMSYWLRTGEEPDSLSFRFSQLHKLDSEFTDAEKATIARFVELIKRQAKAESDAYWIDFAARQSDN